MKSRFSILVLLAATAVLAFTQEPIPPKATFGCHLDEENTNISLHYQRHPVLKFVQLAERPHLAWYPGAKHKFDFSGNSAFTTIQFYFAATVPEVLQGRASEANLLVYARTVIVGRRNFQESRQERWWQLISEAKPEERFKTMEPALIFEAAKLAACFNSKESDCSFAGVAPATPDPSIALFDLSFSVDEDGANASNSTDYHVLLDFRSEPPAVLASLECNNNEGGGVCTASDSGNATRSGFRCTWHAAKNDFWCDANQPLGTYSRSAHDYFYLIAGEAAPPPTSAFIAANLPEAAQRLDSASEPIPAAYVPHYGEVALVIKTPGLLVLGSPGKKGSLFHFIVRGQKKPQSTLSIEPADASLSEAPEPAHAIEHSSSPTPEGTIIYKSRQIYSGHNLRVYRVVSKEGNSHEVYWLGIENRHGETFYDAIRIATEASSYLSCGRFTSPATIVSMSKIAAPFHTAVQIQPPTILSEAEETPQFWSPDSDDPPEECVHSASIEWREGHGFRLGNLSPCKNPEQARRIRISDDGVVELSDNLSQR